MKRVQTFLIAVAFSLLASLAHSAIIFLNGNKIIVFNGKSELAAFNIEARNPGIAVDFEEIAPDTNINGLTINGATFKSVVNSLTVVTAVDTFTPSGFRNIPNPETNTLSATTGTMILSPGGVELVPGPDPREIDDLQISFAAPIKAFGIDILFQSLDSSSYINVRLLRGDVEIAVVQVFTPNLPGGSPAGSHFIGFISVVSETDFDTIQFRESDSDANYPDANIGYDTLYFAQAIPEDR